MASIPARSEDSILSSSTASSLNHVIDVIVEMEFQRQSVVRALQAASNDPDQAVEYLLTSKNSSMISVSSDDDDLDDIEKDPDYVLDASDEEESTDELESDMSWENVDTSQEASPSLKFCSDPP